LSQLLNKFEKAYQSGKMDSIKDCLCPFLEANKSNLKQFIVNFQEKNGKLPLESLIKLFILSNNQPFDMHSYLAKQSDEIKRDLGQSLSRPESRQKLITKWIKEKADSFRNHSIMEQIYCFDKLKAEVLPQFRKELQL
jgi:hypothetical protein